MKEDFCTDQQPLLPLSCQQGATDEREEKLGKPNFLIFAFTAGDASDIGLLAFISGEVEVLPIKI